MASPFPGMDPYLEGEFWQEFHERLANQISIQLMPQLRPKYVALLAKRYVLERPALSLFGLSPERSFYPDVHIVASPKATYSTPAASGLVVTEPTVELPSPSYVPQLTLEIKDVAKRRLVTMIEILSPANKYDEGHREYNQRRIELMQARVHQLELDLLRRGKRISLAGQLPKAEYYVYLSRVENRPFTKVWALGLPDQLPVVPVPLLQPDPDVPLDLQAAVDACFDLVGYEHLLEYTVAPPPPQLDQENAAWLEQTLSAAGWR